ncbi:MAG: hypothetical protein K8R28_02790 [Desulfobacterales bacterium]|nr:hypothetical protein [Desulfobacterales bacterium]
MSKVCREFDIEERLIDFAVRVVRTAESLPKTKIGNHISAQLIRSGTSPQNKNKTSTFDIKSVCSMAKDIIINDATFLYCTRLKS